MPGRKLWRGFARGLTFLVDRVSKGWGVRSLDTAFSEIRVAFEVLKANPASEACSCTRCGCAMVYPGVVVGDAGQAYEVIPTKRFIAPWTLLLVALKPVWHFLCPSVS